MKNLLLAMTLSSFPYICFSQVQASVIDLMVDGPSYNGKTVIVKCSRIFTVSNITVHCEWEDGKKTARADQASMDKSSLRLALTNCGYTNTTCKGTMTGVFVYDQINPLITKARLNLN